MDKHQYMTISDFSRLSGVSRKALIFYDNIGLFRPAHVAENGYRYYHHLQLDTITVIQSLKELGMPLEEIRLHLECRTPERTIQLLQRQHQAILDKICQLQRLSDLVEYRIRRTRQALALDVDAIQLIRREPVPVLISEPVRCPEPQISYETWVRFFAACDENNIPYAVPIGYRIHSDSLRAGQYEVIDRLFIQSGNTQKATAVIPGGTYLVGYLRGYTETTVPLYRRLLAYAEAQGLRLAGHAYQEPLLDEISTSDPGDYLIQTAIRVEPADTDSP